MCQFYQLWFPYYFSLNISATKAQGLINDLQMNKVIRYHFCFNFYKTDLAYRLGVLNTFLGISKTRMLGANLRILKFTAALEYIENENSCEEKKIIQVMKT